MMKSFIAIFLVGASALSIVARDAQTIIADISDIGGKVGTLTTAINNFETLSEDATAVLSAETAVESAIAKGTTDANNSDPFTVDEANQILTAVKNLIPTIVTALNAAVDKYPTFQQQAADQILFNRLRMLKTLTDAFAAALIAKAPSQALSAAQAAIGCIDSGFDSALQMPPARASDCSGNIQLPVGGGGGGGDTETTNPSPTGPTQPGPTNPSPTGPSPTGPSPTGPSPTGPSPTGPSPTGPSPTGSTSTGPPSLINTRQTTGGPAPSPTGGAVVPGGANPGTTPGARPSGEVYIGAASKRAHSLAGAVCLAGLALLI